MGERVEWDCCELFTIHYIYVLSVFWIGPKPIQHSNGQNNSALMQVFANWFVNYVSKCNDMDFSPKCSWQQNTKQVDVT